MAIKSTYILAHEQVHFDICELYTRKLKKTIGTIDLSDYNDEKMDSLFVHYKSMISLEHLRFDSCLIAREKLYGPKTKINLEWKSKIEAQINSLKKYAASHGKVQLKKTKVFRKSKIPPVKQNASKK